MNYPAALDAVRPAIENALESYAEAIMCPPSLKEAMRYSLLAGGKRLRPALVLTTQAMLTEDGPQAMPAACALEFIHTYSLIHDDLPAMDDDDFRRGRPSNHKQFGEALAILAGDALLTEAFVLLAVHYAEAHPALCAALTQEIAQAAGAIGMVGGQVLDIQPPQGMTQHELETLHGMKTGALFRAALRCGALLGGASDEQRTALDRYAKAVGLAFQVADDILDVIGDKEELGKSIGKDEAQGKTTYVTLLGLDEAKSYARSLADEAVGALSLFGEKANPLVDLARFIVDRTH